MNCELGHVTASTSVQARTTWVLTFIGQRTPVAFAFIYPGSLLTRMSLATSLMVLSALNIHQAYGLTELHFGIFVLLAFLLVTLSNGELVRSMATTAGNLKDRGDELSAAIEVFELGVANVGDQPVYGHADFDTEKAIEPRQSLAA